VSDLAKLFNEHLDTPHLWCKILKQSASLPPSGWPIALTGGYKAGHNN